MFSLVVFGSRWPEEEGGFLPCRYRRFNTYAEAFEASTEIFLSEPNTKLQIIARESTVRRTLDAESAQTMTWVDGSSGMIITYEGF